MPVIRYSPQLWLPDRGEIDNPGWLKAEGVLPYGEGWALAGDAALVMDPWSGQGIDQATTGAVYLAGALDALGKPLSDEPVVANGQSVTERMKYDDSRPARSFVGSAAGESLEGHDGHPPRVPVHATQVPLW